MENTIKGTVKFSSDKIVLKYTTGEKMEYKLRHIFTLSEGNEFITHGGQTYMRGWAFLKHDPPFDIGVKTVSRISGKIFEKWDIPYRE